MIKPCFSKLLIALLALQNLAVLAGAEKPTNVIYILADDLGYGDVGCFGQKDIRTPNLDKLASQGMRFTQHYSGSTVCAPSRSVLMTGLHTGHTPIRGNQEVQPEGQQPLPAGMLTLPKLFKSKGYATAAFGKWGLGFPGSEGSPTQQGFDEFFGYNCQRLAHNYYPYYLRHNDEKVLIPENTGVGKGVYGPDLIQEKALEFVRNHKDQPFFMYVPNVLPHAELAVPDDDIRRSYLGKFEETPYKGTDSGSNYKLGGYGSTPTPKTDFAAMVTRLDKQVGEMVNLIEELGLSEHTLIIFSSDNGPHGEGGANPDYFDSNGIYKGMKRDLYEGGIRVPTLMKWPAHIPAGVSTDHVSCFYDMLPTFAELLDIKLTTPHDGLSILPTLLNQSQQQASRDYLYWEFYYSAKSKKAGKKALRQGDWKLISNRVWAEGEEAYELYNIVEDPSETKDLARVFPEKLELLAKLMQASHQPSEVFKFSSKPK